MPLTRDAPPPSSPPPPPRPPPTPTKNQQQLGAARADEIPDDLVLAVAEAVRNLGTGALAVGDTGFQVRRALPLPAAKDAARAVDARSAYARPFPRDATIDAVAAFLNARLAPSPLAAANKEGGDQQQPVNAVNCVRLRRHLGTKDFKGSAFVEFSSKEALARALAMSEAAVAAAAAGGGDGGDDKSADDSLLIYEGAPLRLEAKQAYLTRKIAERKAAAAKAAADGGPALPPLTLQALEEADSDCEAPLLAEINKGVDVASLPPAPEAGRQAKRARQEGDGAGGGAAAAAPPTPAQQQPQQHQHQPQPGCLVRIDLERAEAAAGGENKQEAEAKEAKEVKEAEAAAKDAPEANKEEGGGDGEQQQQEAAAAPAPPAANANANNNTNIDARGLREALGGRHQGVQYVEVAPEPAPGAAVSCFVRYASPDAAKKALEGLTGRLASADGGLPLGDGWRAARASAADADEERLFQERAAAGRAAAEARRAEGGGGGFGGRGRGGGDRKRRFDGPQGGRGGGRGRFGGGGGGGRGGRGGRGSGRGGRGGRGGGGRGRRD
jgi:hypothetical protein